MKRLQRIDREKVKKLEVILNDLHKSMGDIPHLILVGAEFSDNENEAWIHQSVAASSDELAILFGELFKRNTKLIPLMKRIIMWVELHKADNKSTTNFLDKVTKDLKDAFGDTGSTEDVDKLLRDLFDDKEGGQQE